MAVIATVNVQKYVVAVEAIVSLSGEFELAPISNYYKYSEPAPGPVVLWQPLWGGDTLIKVNAPYQETGPYEIFKKTVSGNWVADFLNGDFGGTGTISITGYPGEPSPPNAPTSPSPSHQGIDIRLSWPQLGWSAG